MNLKKIILELLITFFISFFLYSLIDFSLFSIAEWDQDKIFNLIHTWFLLISSYYLYNSCLKLAFDYWKNISVRKLILLLFAVSVLIIIWIIVVELLYYKFYYNIRSLYEETTFFDFDLPVTVVVLTIGSLYFYQKYYTQPLNQNKNTNHTTLDKLTVSKGKKQLFIDYKDIGLVYIENEIVWIETLLGEKFYTDCSLRFILSKIDDSLFFRLNRQVIASRKSIKEFEKIEFQKLRVVLIDDLKYGYPIIVSKYNAPAFKKWLTISRE